MRKTPRAIAKNFPDLERVRIYLPKIDFSDIDRGIELVIHLMLTELVCMVCVLEGCHRWAMCKDVFEHICACSLMAYLLEDYEVVTGDMALPETISDRLLASLEKAGFMD